VRRVHNIKIVNNERRRINEEISKQEGLVFGDGVFHTSCGRVFG
jgi:hypothetical protein